MKETRVEDEHLGTKSFFIIPESDSTSRFQIPNSKSCTIKEQLLGCRF